MPIQAGCCTVIEPGLSGALDGFGVTVPAACDISAVRGREESLRRGVFPRPLSAEGGAPRLDGCALLAVSRAWCSLPLAPPGGVGWAYRGIRLASADGPYPAACSRGASKGWGGVAGRELYGAVVRVGGGLTRVGVGWVSQPDEKLGMRARKVRDIACRATEL